MYILASAGGEAYAMNGACGLSVVDQGELRFQVVPPCPVSFAVRRLGKIITLGTLSCLISLETRISNSQHSRLGLGT